MYEHLKLKKFISFKNYLHTNLLNEFIAGGLAAIVTTLIDVVKTRIMTDAGLMRFVNFSQTFKLIFLDEGIRALLKG